MAAQWQQKKRNYDLTAGKKNQYSYKLPRLVKSDKGWYVIYYIWNVDDEKLERKRVKILGESEQKKETDATEVIKSVTKLLKSGAYTGSKKTVPEPVHPQELTFNQAYQYYKATKSKELRPSTLELNDLYYRYFKSFLESKNSPEILLKKISVKMAFEFIDTVDSGARFRNNLLGFFKSFFTFFIDREDIDRNPFRTIKKLRVDESDDHKPFTAEQAKSVRDALLEKDDEQTWLFCQFIYFLFLRPGRELRLLKVGDILEKQVRVVAGTAKNRRMGFVEIPYALEALIQQYKIRSYPATYYVFSQHGKPGPSSLGENCFYKRHMKILKKLDLFGYDYDLYSWKPTGAIALYRATKDIIRVQRHCRHSAPDQTYTYLRKHGLLFEGQDLHCFPAIWD